MRNMTIAVLTGLSFAILSLAMTGGAHAKAKCELTKATFEGVNQATAKELAMQYLVEAIRDGGMKGRGKIKYTCSNTGVVKCTATQKACQ